MVEKSTISAQPKKREREGKSNIVAGVKDEQIFMKVALSKALLKAHYIKTIIEKYPKRIEEKDLIELSLERLLFLYYKVR